MKLSDHFVRSEFECPCCGLFLCPVRLINSLERLREMCGGEPVIILSGTRCESWNEKVGGAPKSQHLLGNAVDILVRGKHPIEIAEIADRIHSFSHGGIGTYQHRGFVHLDVRLDGPARWGE